MLKIFIAALASLPTMAIPAQAALVDYAVAGKFTNGSDLTGTFSFDDSKVGVAQFRNVSLKIDGEILNYLYGGGNGSSTHYFINVSRSQSANYPVVSLAMNADLSGSAKIAALKEGALNINTRYLPTLRDIYNLSEGTISVVQNSAVPEPTTWMMLVLGFGVIGYAMRRKTVLRYV